jgi:hypothetical protein
VHQLNTFSSLPGGTCLTILGIINLIFTYFSQFPVKLCPFPCDSNPLDIVTGSPLQLYAPHSVETMVVIDLAGPSTNCSGANLFTTDVGGVVSPLIGSHL